MAVPSRNRRSIIEYGFFFSLGVLLTYMHTKIVDEYSSVLKGKERQIYTLRPSKVDEWSDKQNGLNDILFESTKRYIPRKILLDCGGNMASTVELFRETYPEGREYIIHSFEIDERLAPYFTSYSNHHLHCPVGVAEKDGNMTAFSESSWSPNKGMNNGRDMQWGGGTLYVDNKELADTSSGGRRKLSFRKSIPVVDISLWIQENTRKEDYVIFKLDVEGAEFRILEKMLIDGTFAWIDKYYGEYHLGQPVGLSRGTMLKVINDVKNNGKEMFDWGAEIRNYEDFENIHPIRISATAPGSPGEIYEKCAKPKQIALVIEIGMSKKQALRVMSTLGSFRVTLPVAVFVYSEFAEEWPDLVKSWAADYSIGLRGNRHYPTGHFEMMSQNWIREVVVSSEMRLHELDIIPTYYIPNNVVDIQKVKGQLQKRGFRIIKPNTNFPPKTDPRLTVNSYYKFRDVERVTKALRMIYEHLSKADGGILSLDTDLPDTHMNLVFLLDYLVDNSGYKMVTLNDCIDKSSNELPSK